MPESLSQRIRALSSIVGVLLWVGLTILLATTTVTLVMTLVFDTPTAPEAAFETRERPENGTVVFIHSAGESVDAERLALAGPGKLVRRSLGEQISAGDRIRVERITASEGETIRLVWQKGDHSATLANVRLSVSYTAPPATGAVSFVDDIDATTDEFDVEVSDLGNISSVYLVVRNEDQGVSETFPGVGEETVAVDSIPTAAGDDINASIYVSEDRETLINATTQEVDSSFGGPGFTLPAVVLAIVLATLLSRWDRE